ncbi:MAG: rod shape-determining protein MreC [bacterium]|nr:rod shape-determining protein MreC [bacterium]
MIYLAIGVVFYFASGFILSSGFKFLSFVTVPLWKLENNVKDGTGSFRSLFKSKISLEEENRRQTLELENLRIKLESLSSVKKENEDLMSEMGRVIPQTEDPIIASVLSGPNIPPYGNLIIDVGREQDISVGDRVVYSPNVVIGEVSQVFARVSRVKLYSTDGTQTDVMILADVPIHAVVKGYGGGNFFVELPSSVALSIGNEIFIPGSDNYILGVIDNIDIDPITSSQGVLIKYPMNIKNIRFVHVIRGSNDEYLE